MAAPILKRAGLTLKTVGNSHIWLSATGVSIGNEVNVKRRGTAAVIWKGNVDSVSGKGARAKMQFVGIAGYFSDSKAPKGPGDVIDVDVTVTNAGGEESGAVPEEVILDGPN